MKKVIAVLAAGLPVLAFAQTVQTVLLVVGNIVNILIWVVAALALLVFFWGLVKYILDGGASENSAQGRNLMVWGIIALFVMVSVWGLVRVLSNTFGVQSGGVPILPGSGTGNTGFGGNVNVNIPF